jgi:hypothetical protein
VRALAGRCGLSVRAIDDAILRRELEQDVAGLIACLER